MKDHKDIEKNIIDFIYKNFIKYDNSIEIKELYKRIAGKRDLKVVFLQVLDHLKRKGNISSYKHPDENLNMNDNLSITLKGLMVFESDKPFYKRDITNILYGFLDLCKNIEDKEFLLVNNQITIEQLQIYYKQIQNFELDFSKLYFLLGEIKNTHLTGRFHGYRNNPQRLEFKSEKVNILNSSGLSCLKVLRVEKNEFLPIEIEKLIVIPLFEINIERNDQHKHEIQKLLEERILKNQERLIQIISNNLNWLLDPVRKKDLKEYMITKKNRMHNREYNNIIKEISKQLINSEIFNDNEVIQNLFELYLEYNYRGPMVYNVKYRTNQSIRDLSNHLSKYFNSFLRVDLPHISGYLSSHPKIFTSHCMIEYGFECHIYYIENKLPLRNNLYFTFYFLEENFPNKWDDLSERIKVGLKNVISEMRKHYQLDLIEIIEIPEEFSNQFRKDSYIDENIRVGEFESNLIFYNSAEHHKRISEIKDLLYTKECEYLDFKLYMHKIHDKDPTEKDLGKVELLKDILSLTNVKRTDQIIKDSYLIIGVDEEDEKFNGNHINIEFRDDQAIFSLIKDYITPSLTIEINEYFLKGNLDDLKISLNSKSGYHRSLVIHIIKDLGVVYEIKKSIGRKIPKKGYGKNITFLNIGDSFTRDGSYIRRITEIDREKIRRMVHFSDEHIDDWEEYEELDERYYKLNYETLHYYLNKLKSDDIASSLIMEAIGSIDGELEKLKIIDNISSEDKELIQEIAQTLRDFIINKNDEIIKWSIDALLPLRYHSETLLILKEECMQFLINLYEKGKQFDDLIIFLDELGFFNGKLEKIFNSAIEVKDNNKISRFLTRINFANHRNEKIPIMEMVNESLKHLDSNEQELKKLLLSLIKKISQF